MTSALRHARDILRPLVSFEMEYRLRRGAFRLLPTRGVAPGPQHVVHACAWKTASQWVRLILSDPRIYRHSGCLPFPYATVRARPAEARTYRRAKRSVLLAAYESAETIEALSGNKALNSFFVIRDPRMTLVSWYYSTRFTHRPTAGVLAHRAAMEGMTDSAAFSYCASAFAAEFGPILDSWAARAGTARIVQFEALTGPEGATVWADLLAGLGFTVPTATLESVLDTYSISNLAPAAGKGEKDDKYAARGRREWPDFLTPEDNRRIGELLTGWVSTFGYESSDG